MTYLFTHYYYLYPAIIFATSLYLIKFVYNRIAELAECKKAFNYHAPKLASGSRGNLWKLSLKEKRDTQSFAQQFSEIQKATQMYFLILLGSVCTLAISCWWFWYLWNVLNIHL